MHPSIIKIVQHGSVSTVRYVSDIDDVNLRLVDALRRLHDDFHIKTIGAHASFQVIT